MLTFKLCDTDSYRFDDTLTCSYTSYEDSLKICKEQNFTGFVVFKNRVYYRNKKFEDLITNYVYHKDSILYILVPEEYNKQFIQNNERLEFYTKSLVNQKHQLNPTSTHQNPELNITTEKFFNINTLKIKIDSYERVQRKHTKQHHEMLYEYLKILKIPANRGFFIHPYDLRYGIEQPCFVKSRPIKNSKCSILLPLEKLYLPHHMYPDIKDDVKFEHKKNSVVWRGANSGYRANEARRINLVEKFHDYSDFDIGFSNMLYTTDNYDKDYIKKKMSIQEQLQFKFILSVEGNDFATNFSWIMLSNSIPICPIHVIETWFMESKLVPYEHYIPVKNDFSDLIDVYKSALDDHELCQKILFNKKMFCANFLDPQNEDELIKDTINVYFNQCNNSSNEIKLIT